MRWKNLLVGAVMAALLTAVSATAFAYSDVSSGAWYNDAVSVATAHGLMSAITSLRRAGR